MQPLLLLTQIFTRIPVKKSLDYRPVRFREASYLAALHGALVALIPSAAALLLSLARVPAGLNALMTLAFYVGLTGAFHLDGLADSVDGLFSGRPKERILEIMKDPLIGSYGTAAIFFALSLKAYIYFDLINSFCFFFLPLLSCGGKTALIFAACIGKRAKADSSANLWIANIPVLSAVLNALFCLGLALTLGSFASMALALVFVFCTTLWFVWTCNRTIGGLVGDNLGFCAEMGEIMVGIFLVTI